MESFTPQYLTSDETSAEKQDTEFQQDFQLPDLNPAPDSQPTEKNTFNFDNEIQRNFDPATIEKAKEGVQEVFKDAMDRLKLQVDKLKSEAREEGFKAGHEDGFQAGEQVAREEFEPFLEALQKLVEDLSQFRQKMFPKVEREMVDMIVMLTKKVIKTEMTSREDSIQDVIRLAVQSVLDRERMVIKVNPADKIHAETYRPELHHLFSEIKNITIEEQPSIERGGCLIESNFGTVDAQLHNLQNQIDSILSIAPDSVEEMPLPPDTDEETPPVAETSDPVPPPDSTEPETDSTNGIREGE